VSCSAISIPALANIVPDIPPITNSNIKPQANKTGTLKTSRPPHIVATQPKTFIPVGTAIIRVAAVK